MALEIAIIFKFLSLCSDQNDTVASAAEMQIEQAKGLASFGQRRVSTLPSLRNIPPAIPFPMYKVSSNTQHRTRKNIQARSQKP